MDCASTSTYRVRAIVCGRVQGVGFRASTVREGQALGLCGSAKNLADGSVEVIAQGSETDVQALLDWLHHGPALAKVESFKWERIAPSQTAARTFLRL